MDYKNDKLKEEDLKKIISEFNTEALECLKSDYSSALLRHVSFSRMKFQDFFGHPPRLIEFSFIECFHSTHNEFSLKYFDFIRTFFRLYENREPQGSEGYILLERFQTPIEEFFAFAKIDEMIQQLNPSEDRFENLKSVKKILETRNRIMSPMLDEIIKRLKEKLPGIDEDLDRLTPLLNKDMTEIINMFSKKYEEDLSKLKEEIGKAKEERLKIITELFIENLTNNVDNSNYSFRDDPIFKEFEDYHFEMDFERRLNWEIENFMRIRETKCSEGTNNNNENDSSEKTDITTTTDSIEKELTENLINKFSDLSYDFKNDSLYLQFKMLCGQRKISGANEMIMDREILKYMSKRRSVIGKILTESFSVNDIFLSIQKFDSLFKELEGLKYFSYDLQFLDDAIDSYLLRTQQDFIQFFSKKETISSEDVHLITFRLKHLNYKCGEPEILSSAEKRIQLKTMAYLMLKAEKGVITELELFALKFLADYLENSLLNNTDNEKERCWKSEVNEKDNLNQTVEITNRLNEINISYKEFREDRWGQNNNYSEFYRCAINNSFIRLNWA